MRILVWGAKGWIGQQFTGVAEARGHTIIPAGSRADDLPGVNQELESVKPDRVVCMIGRTHGPGYSTIDYLEQPGKLQENVRDNLYGPLNIAISCMRNRIHMTYLGTGCIFEYDEDHTNSQNGRGFIEGDASNFFGSSYSVVKGFTDQIFHDPSFQVLNVRIRMPITAEDNPRNFISKIIRYVRVCSVSNSMTVLPNLLPHLCAVLEEGTIGTLNLVNPGVISHNEILQMYKDIVDPTFSWRNFTIEEQNSVLLARRSNNKLDTHSLELLCPSVKHIHEAVRECLESWHPCFTKNTPLHPRGWGSNPHVKIEGGDGKEGRRATIFFHKTQWRCEENILKYPTMVSNISHTRWRE